LSQFFFLTLATQKTCLLIIRIDLVNLFINEINSDSHVVVNQYLVVLVHFDSGEFIFRSLLEGVQSVLEKFGFARDFRIAEEQLVPWLKAVCFSLLELLVPLRRTTWNVLFRTSLDLGLV